VQSARSSVLPQLFPVSHGDSSQLVQVRSEKLVIAVHSCTLSKSVAWSDTYVSVVSLTTYTNIHNLTYNNLIICPPVVDSTWEKKTNKKPKNQTHGLITIFKNVYSIVFWCFFR